MDYSVRISYIQNKDEEKDSPVVDLATPHTKHPHTVGLLRHQLPHQPLGQLLGQPVVEPLHGTKQVPQQL